jgi:hypothetical protein
MIYNKYKSLKINIFNIKLGVIIHIFVVIF